MAAGAARRQIGFAWFQLPRALLGENRLQLEIHARLRLIRGGWKIRAQAKLLEGEFFP